MVTRHADVLPHEVLIDNAEDEEQIEREGGVLLEDKLAVNGLGILPAELPSPRDDH